jgi:hypothetical protein
MKNLARFLAAGTILAMATGINLTALGQDAEEPAKIQPIFDGKFKCTDGYDPDTDASLHAPNQDPRQRALINAEAQAAHEKALAEKGSEGAGSGASTGSTSTAGTTGEESKPAENKGGNEKKEGEKKEGEKKEGEKKEGEKKEGEKKEGEKKEAEKKAAAGKGEAAEKTGTDGKKEPTKDPPTPQANNPISMALYAMQSKKYQESVDILKALLVKETKNAQAHYLLAVNYVGMRRYSEAAEQYNLVLKLAAGDPKLSQMAADGLKRISGPK